MTKLDYLNLSTDLRRISLWLMEGQDDMVAIFMPRILAKFGRDRAIRGKKAVADWLGEIGRYKEERHKAAEKSLTLSSILL